MAFDATVGGAAATSYVSVADALAFWGNELTGDAWTSESTAKQQLALMSATRRFEQLRWLGRKSSSSQALAWPRAQVPKPDGVLAGDGYGLGSGQFYDSTTMPAPLVEATCRHALKLLQDGPVDPGDGDALAGLTSLSLGPLSFSKASGGDTDGDLSPEVRRLLGGLTAALAGTFRIRRA